MRRPAASILVVLVAITGAVIRESNLQFDADAAKDRPVSKVVKLLEGIQKDLEKEADDDQDTYDKFACWCETGEKSKTKSIKDAKLRIEDLTAEIGELTGAVASLAADITHTKKEIAENQQALDQAIKMRKKGLAEFNAEEKDLLESIASVKTAILVLSKHNGASLAEIPHASLLSMKTSLDQAVSTQGALLQDVLTKADRKIVNQFIQSGESGDHFDSEPTFKQSYAPQSGQIFGILKQMRESFETNLVNSQKEETESQKTFESVKAGKEKEIAASTKLLKQMVADHADKDEKNQEAHEGRRDTKAALEADEEYLKMLRERCENMDAEFEQRRKNRETELDAVAEALSYLNSDDAHDLFGKTFSFMQIKSSADSVRRSQASKLAMQAYSTSKDPKLAVLATRMRLDGFKEIKKILKKMIDDLIKEDEDEIKRRDYCKEAMATNLADTKEEQYHMDKVTDKLQSLKASIKMHTDNIATWTQEIADLTDELDKASQDRQKENKVFQEVVNDQRATQRLLQVTLGILGKVYRDKSLMQKSAQGKPAGPPPPPGFESYEKNDKGSGVVGMITQIIVDAQHMEAEAVHDENTAQETYEIFARDSFKSIHEKTKAIETASAEKANQEEDQVDKTKEQSLSMFKLEQLDTSLRGLHRECDFLMKNFDLRRDGRHKEMEMLRNILAVFSGAI